MIINLKLAIIFGTNLERIRVNIEQFEDLHLGLFINSLRYKKEKEGKKLKNDFIKSTTQSIKLINKEIKDLNIFIKYLNKTGLHLALIEKIDNSTIKKIILSHKGHYPKEEGVGSFIKDALGEGDSPSILARRYTSLQISNVILKTKISLSNFVKSLNDFLRVFESIDRSKLRQSTQKEIEKIRAFYSMGFFGEAIFITGRLLECLLTEYILILKKSGKIYLTKKQILDLDFHNKIETLHSKKLSILSESQFSKLMSIKWDRNIYGHKIGLRTKDYQAIITIGLIAIDVFEKKLVGVKKR